MSLAWEARNRILMQRKLKLAPRLPSLRVRSSTCGLNPRRSLSKQTSGSIALGSRSPRSSLSLQSPTARYLQRKKRARRRLRSIPKSRGPGRSPPARNRCAGGDRKVFGAGIRQWKENQLIESWLGVDHEPIRHVRMRTIQRSGNCYAVSRLWQLAVVAADRRTAVAASRRHHRRRHDYLRMPLLVTTNRSGLGIDDRPAPLLAARLCAGVIQTPFGSLS